MTFRLKIILTIGLVLVIATTILTRVLLKEEIVAEEGRADNPTTLGSVSNIDDKFFYKNDKYRFSFALTEEMEVKVADVTTGGETILFLKNDDDEEDEQRKGFQIFISPFRGETGVLTRARIRADHPMLVVEDPIEVILGDGTHALIFFSTGPVKDSVTREVWFVKRGNLYAVTTYAELDPWMAQIMASWRFD